MTLLLPALTAALSQKDTGSGLGTEVTWPACEWHTVDDSTANELQRIFMASDSLYGHPADVYSDEPFVWREVAHPLLSALLPGVRWFLVRPDVQRFGRPPCYPVAVHRDRVYSGRELNSLLADSDSLADTKHWRERAVVPVLFALLGESAARIQRLPTLKIDLTADDIWSTTRNGGGGTARVGLGEAYPERHAAEGTADSLNKTRRLADSLAWTIAIPEVEFGGISRTEMLASLPDPARIEVHCSVAGQERLFRLTTSRGQLVDMNEEHGQGSSSLYDAP